MSTQAGAAAFDISDWRQGVKARREIMRSIIVRAVVGREQLEVLLHDLMQAIRYRHLDDADQNRVRVMIHDARTIARYWRDLPPAEQKQFIAGKGAPSSLAARLRKEFAADDH